MSVPCTFKSCPQTFKTEKQMKTHKIYGPQHSYCKCCDEDFEDDLGLFIHQLGSSNHIVCPVDALEFRSSAARDIHFEQCHPQKQSLHCAGCEGLFTSASSLVRHIEKDECSVIRSTEYNLQRVDRQLDKEAWESEAKGSKFLSADSIITSPPISKPTTSFPKPDLSVPLGGPIPNSAIEQFPPLPDLRQSRAPPEAVSSTRQSNTDLLDLTEPEARMGQLKISHHSWSNDGTYHCDNEPQSHVTDDRVHYWLKAQDDNFSSAEDAPSRPQTESSESPGGMSFITQKQNYVPPSIRSRQPVQHEDINLIPLQSVTNQSVNSSPSLDDERFWDPWREEYVCTAHGCHGQGFKTHQEFQQHKLSSIHTGGQVVCPGCLKWFKTQAGFLAHAATRNRKCKVKESFHFNTVVREQTGGMLGAEGFMEDGVTPRFTAQKLQDW
ncbi:hypothetical protein B0A52_09086 [Exophiala mesophila]|uniref:C2H2-type domain-containing protein n=1 Tax=Exophiala mesophila TaxID=212818 RepID=A0A438MTH6_EXOME|nr:hypothetical protein B0A52_09086 [Exophiala mesophila]